MCGLYPTYRFTGRLPEFRDPPGTVAGTATNPPDRPSRSQDAEPALVLQWASVDKQQHAAAAPILQSIVPVGAVPARLRTAVRRVLAGWGYGWEDVSFAGTAALAQGDYWQLAPGAGEIWVLAVASAPLEVGDELRSAGGRATGVALSAFSGGVIPVTPYLARVYEYLGPRGGGDMPESPTGRPTTPGMEPAAPDQQR